MRSVDTNVLVRLIARDDEKQRAAADAFVAGGAWVSHLVLAESIWVLESVYERSTNQIATAVEMLLDHQSISLQEPETIQAALVTFRSSKGTSFSDCLILETARRAGHIPLGTFDKALGKLPGTEKLG